MPTLGVNYGGLEITINQWQIVLNSGKQSPKQWSIVVNSGLGLGLGPGLGLGLGLGPPFATNSDVPSANKGLHSWQHNVYIYIYYII